MKIMFNTMGLGKGGAERVISILANYLCKGHTVRIVTHIYTKPKYDFDKRVIIESLAKDNNNFLRKLRRVSPFMLYKLKKIVNKYKPDIIISFLPEPSFRILLLKKYCKAIKQIPVIVSVRNDPNTEYSNKLYYYVMKKLYPYATELVLQTKDSLKYFKQNIKYTGIVIPNPVSKRFMVKRYEGEREKRIVAVGRLEPQKNYKIMIDAFEFVSKKHTDYEFNIFGEGSLKNELQEYINKKHLQDKIILKGQENNIEEKIYKATAFVMSSNYEGMPNSLLEAACLGIPCVSTDCPCGGAREILCGGKNGILVDVNDSYALSRAINKIIDDKNYANKIGTLANNNAIKYQENVILAAWEKLIKNMEGKNNENT